MRYEGCAPGSDELYGLFLLRNSLCSTQAITLRNVNGNSLTIQSNITASAPIKIRILFFLMPFIIVMAACSGVVRVIFWNFFSVSSLVNPVELSSLAFLIILVFMPPG